MSISSKSVFLIDGTAFCYRAFYAIRSLTTSQGRPTNAVYGFAVMLKALQEKNHPDYLAVAFDVGKPTFRHERFHAYKAQRKPMPDQLISQLPLVKRLLKAYRIPVFEQEGYEAEDVLATLATQIAGKSLDVFLVTGDKDALQLVDSHIKIYNPHKDDIVLDADAISKRYGVEPSRIVDVMALAGDDIDNIPGVPGIGEKTATQLVQRFGSVEGIYQHLDEVDNAACRHNLQGFRERVDLSRSLAQIDRDVPISFSLEELKTQAPDSRALRHFFRELEFKRLLQGIDASVQGSSTLHVAAEAITSAASLDALVDRLSKNRNETVCAMMAWPHDGSDSIVLALAFDHNQAWVIRFDEALRESPSGKKFSFWLSDGKSLKISHDAKTTIRILSKAGITLHGIIGDTMLAAYLLNPSRTNQSLADLADEHLDLSLAPLPRTVDLEGFAAQDAVEVYGRYACIIRQVHEHLLGKLGGIQLGALYADLEIPLLSVLARMELKGVALDMRYLNALRASMEAKLSQLTKDIYQLAGGSFNINSPRQLAQVLFEKLQLPVIKRTKTGASTDSEVLRQLAARHPLPQRLIEFRELSKLVSTYVEALPRLVDPASGRLHTTLNQASTSTGRLSSSEPNLQNIPIRTELGRAIRKAFIAGIPDGVLVSADYSQIELRILAHLSADEHLTGAFANEHDIHRFTASLIYGVPESEVSQEQRNAMKAINYGIIYGMSPHGLSKELGISFEDAQNFIESYFARYPKVREYLNAQIELARRDGFVQTLLGRRRYIPEVNSYDNVIRQVGERMAINAPIQGTAADLIKRAMIELDRELFCGRFSSSMVLQVHDELIFEAPRKELHELAAFVRRVMEGAIKLSVPLKVSVKAGPNWLDMEELK